MASVRIYQKKEIRLDRLSFKQTQMFKIGTVGVAAVKNRVMAAHGPNDGPAKPLSRLYAIQKTKMGKGNRRNLILTGDLLRNFQVRTVSENKAVARATGRGTTKTTTNKRGKSVGIENKVKAWITNKIEPWAVFSPKNNAAVRDAAQQVVAEIAPRLAIERSLGGKQR
jgi:hypothetical protein